jgi:hypothetical protein
MDILVDAVHQLRDLGLKLVLMISRWRPYLHHGVEQRGADGIRIHAQLGKQYGHFKGMYDIGFAREAFLVAVGFLGEAVGALHQIQVGAWIVGLYEAQ